MKRIRRSGFGFRMAFAILLSASFFTCRIGVDEPGDNKKTASGAPTPANGARNVAAMNLALSWDFPATKGKTGIRYDVYLGTSNPPQTVLVRDLVSPTRTVPSLTPGATYYWRVDYLDGSTLVTGPVWRFTTTSDVNDPPAFVGLRDTSIDEGQQLRLTLLAPDPDGDSVAYSQSAGPQGATLAGNIFTWTPNFSQSGVHQIRFLARDNGLPQLSDTATIAVTVRNVSAPPVLQQPGDTTVNEGHTLRITLSASDPDGHTFVYSMRNVPSGATLAGNTFTWTPDTNQAGTYIIDFVVTEQTVDSLRDTATVRVTVRDISIPSGLLASWNFNEGNGTTAYDQTTHGHDVTLQRTPEWIVGIEATGIRTAYFEPAGTEFQFGAGDYSLETWFKWDGGDSYLFSCNGVGFRIWILSSGLINYRFENSSQTFLFNSKTVVIPDIFNHYVFQRKGDTLKIFINGSIDTSFVGPLGNAPIQSPLNVGKLWFQPAYANGTFDNVRIHNRAIDPSEILSEWNHSKGGVSLTTGLVAYWPFSGNANDASGNGNNGTVSGASLTADRIGNANGAYKFDGVGNYITVDNSASLNLTSAFTISAWIKPQVNTTVTSQIVDKSSHANNSAYSFYLNEGDANRIRGVYYEADTWTATDDTVANLYDGAWRHVAFTATSGRQEIYVDGILGQAETRTMSGTSTNTGVLTIGNGTARSYFLKGELDDIRIYNRAINPAEIRILANEGR